MKFLTKGEWQYALLMVLLLIIATIASVQTISNIDDLVRSLDKELLSKTVLLRDHPGKSGAPVMNESGTIEGYISFNWDTEPPVNRLVNIITLTIYALTMGFILLSGAFGIWAVRFTAEIEGRKRVGRFVDDMDYLRDGLLVLDKKGDVTGINPSAHRMVAREPDGTCGIREMFPCLSAEDARLLLKPTRPHEIERKTRTEEGQRIWRFRSQPTEDMDLVLICDVTDERVLEMRQRQAANLQIVGRIARGVAHDFNNILCAVSGHASLLKLPSSALDADKESLDAILKESQRGANLAAHLLELSRSGKSEHPTERIKDHVEKAVELLRVGLSSAWQIKTEFAENIPVVPMSPVQIEQAVLNLGLIAADQCTTPNLLSVSVRGPRREFDLDVGDEFGVLIMITSQDKTDTCNPGDLRHKDMIQTTLEEAGVIQSVVRAMVEEVGGRLDIMRRSGHCSYRICLPAYVTEGEASHPAPATKDLTQFLTDWDIMLAAPPSVTSDALRERMEHHGARVDVADDIVGTLSRLNEKNAYRAIMLDRNILGPEGDGLLKAICKLQPEAGLVVISDDVDAMPTALKEDIIFEDRSADAGVLLESLLRARARRKKR
ncbi:MAG: hypothetical protein EOM20_10600 [Spartobacteria bacterium]|nr:hypothetical protein [Spartobacteria bacterium]